MAEPDPSVDVNQPMVQLRTKSGRRSVPRPMTGIDHDQMSRIRRTISRSVRRSDRRSPTVHTVSDANFSTATTANTVTEGTTGSPDRVNGAANMREQGAFQCLCVPFAFSRCGPPIPFFDNKLMIEGGTFCGGNRRGMMLVLHLHYGLLTHLPLCVIPRPFRLPPLGCWFHPLGSPARKGSTPEPSPSPSTLKLR
jgi:hypothetical protein